jgi:hypothetical protein
MFPKGVMVTIRGGGELLLLAVFFLSAGEEFLGSGIVTQE